MYIPHCEGEKKIIIFSGAGLDAPSGIKTFRDSHGLWNKNKIDDVCNINTWKKNFSLVHDFYNERRKELQNSKPNIAHKEIVKIINKYGKENVINITMNISDFFERLNTEVLYLHGELRKMECFSCGNNWDINYSEFNIKTNRCPKCNSLKGVKPKVVFFGEPARLYTYMYRAFEAINNPETIVIIIGTTGTVINVNNLIYGNKCKTILCNMDSSLDIDENKFDYVFLESIETGIFKIKKIIEKYYN
jgi:NAD-dependent deacetylase